MGFMSGNIKSGAGGFFGIGSGQGKGQQGIGGLSGSGTGGNGSGTGSGSGGGSGPTNSFLLMETADFILQEDLFGILLE